MRQAGVLAACGIVSLTKNVDRLAEDHARAKRMGAAIDGLPGLSVDLGSIEPYFLILGTREPRKNVAQVLELIARYPDLLDRHRFVFAGKLGWLANQQEMPEVLGAATQAGKILFTGFVTEYEKYKLLLGAQATIYPSVFEGFGLPVLESLSVGTPCVASFSSSIPEAGGAFCHYFDPLSVTDLHRALMRQIVATVGVVACGEVHGLVNRR